MPTVGVKGSVTEVGWWLHCPDSAYQQTVDCW